MKIFTLIVCSLSLLVACKPKTEASNVPEMPANADVATYETEVLKIHDAAMPKMTVLNQLETTLRDMRTNAGHPDEGPSQIPAGIDEMITSLKSSQNGMLDWMEYYSAMRAKLQPDVMLEFMKGELVKITGINKNMDDTISKVNAWLAARPK